MTNRQGITSDVPNVKEEHAKRIHEWFILHKKRETFQCPTCKLNLNPDVECEFLNQQVDGVSCGKHTELMEQQTTRVPNKCGDCAVYKTNLCTFNNQEGYIKKTDYVCSDFQFDRHLIRKKKPYRRMTFAQRVTNL